MKYITKKEDTIYFKKRSVFKITCSYCGHTTYDMIEDREICSWCNHWIYKNKKVEFRYKLKEAILHAKTKIN